MGRTRKVTSVATGGLVHYRTANERTARYTKKIYELEKRQAPGKQASAAENIEALQQTKLGRVALALFLGVFVLVVLYVVVYVIVQSV